MSKQLFDAFEKHFFFNELNRFVGTGGEILVKSEQNKLSSQTLIEVGDQLIGIGVTQMVETLSRPPGPDSFHATNRVNGPVKMAMRAFQVASKQASPTGFDIKLSPLTPLEYSNLASKVSEGALSIDVKSIPEGTMILSYVAQSPAYTLEKIAGSPAANWAALAEGVRHWNIGVAKSDDFWAASFPSDDIGLLTQILPGTRVGSIRFGLSVLPGSEGLPDLELVECVGPNGNTSKHHFCLSGSAIGTKGLDTPFPIGLRTEIQFRPVTK